MPTLETVSPETKQTIEQLGTVDIVVAIPSYNNAGTIGQVIHQVQTGLQTHFASVKSIILHTDGGSGDGTPERVLEGATGGIPLVQVPYPVYAAQKLTTAYFGVPARNSAYRTIFELALQLQTKACVIIDGDVSPFSAPLIEQLVRPVLDQQFDFIAPYYFRHKFDGTVTKSMLYPGMRALYGKRVRQPVSGDLGLSSKFIQHCLAQDVWNSEVTRSAIDIWIATQAICRGFRICQVFAGAKRRGPRDPTADVTSMMSQVLSAAFFEVERNITSWQRVRGSEAVSFFGTEVIEEVEPVSLDLKRMIDSFRIGQQNLQEIWSLILPPATLVELKKLARRTEQDFRLQDSIWVRIVYDFALAYHLRVINRDHLLQALAPLYWAWLTSFAIEMQDAGHAEAEARIEQLCLRYEAEKPYLISRWRWPDRFNP